MQEYGKRQTDAWRLCYWLPSISFLSTASLTVGGGGERVTRVPAMRRDHHVHHSMLPVSAYRTGLQVDDSLRLSYLVWLVLLTLIEAARLRPREENVNVEPNLSAIPLCDLSFLVSRKSNELCSRLNVHHWHSVPHRFLSQGEAIMDLVLRGNGLATFTAL
jgi:hypothetical protein